MPPEVWFSSQSLANPLRIYCLRQTLPCRRRIANDQRPLRYYHTPLSLPCDQTIQSEVCPNMKKQDCHTTFSPLSQHERNARHDYTPQATKQPSFVQRLLFHIPHNCKPARRYAVLLQRRSRHSLLQQRKAISTLAA